MKLNILCILKGSHDKTEVLVRVHSFELPELLDNIRLLLNSVTEISVS